VRRFSTRLVFHFPVLNFQHAADLTDLGCVTFADRNTFHRNAHLVSPRSNLAVIRALVESSFTCKQPICVVAPLRAKAKRFLRDVLRTGPMQATAVQRQDGTIQGSAATVR